MDAAQIVETYAIASKVCGAILIICMMALAMYLIWNWYKLQLEKEETIRQKQLSRERQTEIAWKYLERDKTDLYEKQIRDLKKQIAKLEKKNKDMNVRLETIAKAKPIVKEN